MVKKYEGYRSQITAVVGAVFTAVNAFLPDLFTTEVEAAVLTILLFVYGLFFAAKVQRPRN